MSTANNNQKAIQVCADWKGLPDPVVMGTLFVRPVRGQEVFSFEYDPDWLESDYAQILDPELGLYSGPQYTRDDRPNFGIFLDSSPDRWGRVLMQRREAQLARQEDRDIRTLLESDYLLGVYDGHRMGGLRFRMSEDGPFLDDHADMASPPWAQLRDLEYASLQLEREDAESDSDYMNWLKMLIAPGGSLGGARPKASVIDEACHPWIAKFPSLRDERNMGAWEFLIYSLAINSGIETSISQIQNFSGAYDTFMTKRFDRTDKGERIHFASAITMLGKKDGDSAETGVSYLDLADFLIKNGAEVTNDLEQLWRRIVFNICVSNIDDHLRNHGFLLREDGWILSPAYDMNPSPTGDGLTLNISRDDNAKNLELARSVAPFFRIENPEEIIDEVLSVVCTWSQLAKELKLPNWEINLMKNAFLIS